MVPTTENQKVVIANSTVSKALLRILNDDKLEEIASAEVSTEESKKPNTVLKIYKAGDLVILFPQDGLSSKHIGQIIKNLGTRLSKPLVIGLSTVYKTQYGTAEGSISIDEGEPLPLRYTRSSHANAQIDSFAKTSTIDTAFNFTGGLTAAYLQEAEMTGLGAIGVRSIDTEHRVTVEGMQAFAPVVQQLLGLPAAKMNDLFDAPAFKPVLRELNAKSHGIYS